MAERIVSLHAFYTCGSAGVHAYLSHPTAHGPWPAVVIGHEWWGLEEHVRELSRRLAREGMVVLVPDLYHGAVTAQPAEAAGLKTALDIDQAVGEIIAAVPYLRGLPFVAGKVGVLGFCMGGGLALLAAGRSSEFFSAGVIYFPSIYPDASEIEQIRCPLLIHYGTADVVTPRSEIDRITRTLERAHTPCELHLYDGANHAFVNDTHPEMGEYNREAAEAAWPRTVAFLQRYLAA